MSTLVNHFVVCLDRSGSMEPLAKKAVDAFNQNVRSIREGARVSGQKSTVSLVTFGGDIREHFFCEPVEALQTWDYREYRPSGGTPLFDAVFGAIDKLQKRYDAQDAQVSYVVLVITDGEENTSVRCAPSSFASVLASAQKTDRWSFAFLLPPGSARSFCQTYGVPEGNVKEWEATQKGAAAAAAAVDQGIGNYFSLRSSGMKSTKGFFTTDLSNVSQAEVRQKLVDIRAKVLVGEVGQKMQIRDFVEKTFKVRYVKGQAYYHLMKDELVQHHKQVIMRERDTGVTYGGTDARKLLGLPDNLDVKVRPGDHAGWDVFVQSTSVNRNLVPGTKVLYVQ